MFTNEDGQKYKTCSHFLDEGKYKEAIELADSITAPELRAGIFIDAGFALGKSGKVREGTEIFENLLSSGQVKHISKSSLLYNAANGRKSIYDLRRKRRRRTIPPNDIDLRAAKKLYRDTIVALDDSKGPLASQVFVNYGNCLSALGRYVEAIEYYQKAFDADPENGMAAGNLGAELEHAAELSGRYRHQYIALAHSMLKRALGNEMHLKYGSVNAAQEIQHACERLELFINAHTEPILPPQPIEVVARTETQLDYLRFCIDNGFILNSWVGNKELSPGAIDDVSFGSIVTRVADRYFVTELLQILNEIKESFAVARYNFYLSQRKDDILDDISHITLYSQSQDFEINGIYMGLCKTAYSQAFNVLDKVARITNVYFGFGRRDDTFWSIFAERQSLGDAHDLRFAARPAVCKTQNHSLYALADLCIDYFESEHADLKTIDARRNRITHDYLGVRLYSHPEGKDIGSTIGLDDLKDQTRSVLLLAKYAILYVVSAIKIAEARKRRDYRGKSTEFQIPTLPGQPFL